MYKKFDNMVRIYEYTKELKRPWRLYELISSDSDDEALIAPVKAYVVLVDVMNITNFDDDAEILILVL